MKTSYIINEINNHFAEIYTGASPFVNSGDLWDFCIATISDPIKLSEIVFANDLGIPPVRSLLLLWERETHPGENFEFKDRSSVYMGSLMGFVFKFVLGYNGQKDRCAIKRYGIKTAARFIDGPVIEFEKDNLD